MYPRPYGNYVLLERLGQGGMSEVDLARRAVEDADYVRFLVIKRIKASRTEDASFVRMFKDEARISAQLHHGHIAQVYDFGRQDDEYYMVLEYIPGLDARQVLRTLGEHDEPLPLRIALRIAADVLDGLQYAHSRLDAFGEPMKIVHRDVNPRNVMISIGGEVKLIDFGVAKAQGRLERTRTHHIKGKFTYMAPEQLAGEQVDHRADLFAVGLTLHELVTGRNPLSGLNQVQIMHRVMEARLPPIDDHPELDDMGPLRAVQDKALAKDPDDRFAEAAAYRRALEEVAEPLGGFASQQEIARLIEGVDPGIGRRLRQKMRDYAGKLPPPQDMPGPPAIREPSQSGTLRTMSQTGVVLGGGMVLGVVGVLLVGGLGAAAAAFVLLGDEARWPGVQAQPGPVEVVEDPVPAEPAPAGEGEADPPGPSGEANAPAAPSETPSEASPASPPPASTQEPSSPPPEPAQAEPEEQGGGSERDMPSVGEPADGDEAPVEEGAADAPPDQPVVRGTLQVTATESGRAIYLDGERVEHTTPARFSWPAGTVTVKVEGFEPKQVSVPERQVVTLLFR